MNRQELFKRLKGHEWTDVEFKEAQHDVPKSAYETVSAFANTHGGWLVFGVRQTDAGFEISGVGNVDKVQGDFLSALHADNKVSHDIAVTPRLIRVVDRTVLIFRIAENQRTRKPVYLDGDIRRTFLRKGGGDYKAQMQDIERMLRDATSDRWDSQPFEKVPLKDAFHPGSLKWYRDRFHQVNAGFDPKQSDRDFLYHWGFLLKDGKRYVPTRAAVMLFGSSLAVHQLIPRPTLDVQFLGYGTGETMPETRWIDRIVCEDNIIQAWEQLVTKYRFFMPKPFRDIDPVTLGRRDDPPGFRVFREAAINLLIHQDYGDHSRKAVIKFYRDGIEFWNPGDVFGDDTRLWEPGEKEVRNPAIAMAMRRVAMCEQAGTGLRMMRGAWQDLGHPSPTYKNDRAHKAFELFIPGLDKEVDMASDLVKAMFGKDGKTPVSATGVEAGVQSGAQSGAQSGGQSQMAMAVLRALESGAAGKASIAASLGKTGRTRYLNDLMKRLLNDNLVEYTMPNKPNSRLQRYRLTEQGIACLKASKV